MTGSCINRDVLLAYSEDQLGADEAAAVERHLSCCLSCLHHIEEYRSLTNALDAVAPPAPRDLVRRALERRGEVGSPLRFPPFGPRRRSLDRGAGLPRPPRTGFLQSPVSWLRFGLLGIAVALGTLAGFLASPRSAPEKGLICEIYAGVRGRGVEDLKRSPRFPKQPDRIEKLAAFDTPPFGDHYGQRVRGYLTPPVSGDYVFWISADDSAELILSAGDNPSSSERIASVPDWTLKGEWTKYPQQHSAPIYLSAGRRYYIEAVMKQEGGGNHLIVKWTLPDGTEESPIPGKRLTPFM